MDSSDQIEQVKGNEKNDSGWNISRSEEQPLNIRKKGDGINESNKFSEVLDEILKSESPRLPSNNDENAVVADFTCNEGEVDAYLVRFQPEFKQQQSSIFEMIRQAKANNAFSSDEVDVNNLEIYEEKEQS